MAARSDNKKTPPRKVIKISGAPRPPAWPRPAALTCPPARPAARRCRRRRRRRGVSGASSAPPNSSPSPPRRRRPLPPAAGEGGGQPPAGGQGALRGRGAGRGPGGSGAGTGDAPACGLCWDRGRGGRRGAERGFWKVVGWGCEAGGEAGVVEERRDKAGSFVLRERESPRALLGKAVSWARA